MRLSKEYYFTILNSKTFVSLTFSNMKKFTSPSIYRLHFSNCRFVATTLEDVFEQAYDNYNAMTNIVSRNN